MSEIKFIIPNWLIVLILITIIWVAVIKYIMNHPKKLKCIHEWQCVDEHCLGLNPPEYIHTYTCNKCNAVKFNKDHNSIAELNKIHERALEAIKREK